MLITVQKLPNDIWKSQSGESFVERFGNVQRGCEQGLSTLATHTRNMRAAADEFVVFTIALVFNLYAAAFAAPSFTGAAIDNYGAELLLLGEVNNLSARISGVDSPAETTPLLTADIPKRTLFLVDTFVSEYAQSQITELLSGMIENKRPSESFAIAVFGDGAYQLIGYTYDRFDLISALGQIEYRYGTSRISEALVAVIEHTQQGWHDPHMRQVMTYNVNFNRIIKSIKKTSQAP